MTLTVEDGTGVAGADTYVDVAYVSAFATARNLTFTGTTAAQEAAIRAGLSYVDHQGRFPFRGSKTSATARTEWPRTGASEFYGPAIPETYVPWRVQDAQALAAILVLGGTVLQAKLDRGGKIASKKMDVLSVTYAADAPAEAVYPEIVGLLSPLLRTTGIEPMPYLAQTEDTYPYQTDIFDNTAFGANGSETV